MHRVLLTLVSLVVLAGCGRDVAPPAPAGTTPAAPPTTAEPDRLRLDPSMTRDLRLTTARVERRDAAADVDMLGELGVNLDAYAEVAPPIDAQVVRLLVAANTRVRAGEPLAVLRSPEVGRARAAVAAADARATLANQVLARKRLLAADRIVAAREVEEAEAQVQEAQAALRAATAGLRALGVEGDEPPSSDPSAFVVRTPVGGTVLERTATLGQLAQTETPMFRIAGLDRLWLNVHAFERDAVQVVAGTPVRVTLAALPGREFPGAVTVAGRRVEPSSRTVELQIDLNNPDDALRPGMSATAHVPIRSATRTLLAVPAAAVQRVGEQWMVFSPDDAGTFRMRPVGRGRDLGGEIEILTGLEAADTVVVDGAFLLKAEADKQLNGAHEHED